MPSASRARLLLVAAAALFSTGGAAIKGCTLSGWQVAGLRSLVAAVFFVAFVPAARVRPSRLEWLVGAGYAATMILFVVANKLTTSANTIFLQSTAPFYILLASPFVLGERIRARDVAFLAAMASGLALFFLDEDAGSATAPRPFLGNLLALGSGVFWATTVMGLRWMGRRAEERARRGDAPPASGEGFGAVVAGNVLAFLGCLPLAWPVEHVSGGDLAILVYLGCVQIGLAYLCLTTALRAVPAFEASVLLLVEPVLNPIWALVVHGERPGPYALAGGAVLVLATLAKSWFDARSPARASADGTT